MPDKDAGFVAINADVPARIRLNGRYKTVERIRSGKSILQNLQISLFRQRRIKPVSDKHHGASGIGTRTNIQVGMRI